MKKWIVICILALLVIGMVLMSGCTMAHPYQVRVIYPGEWRAMYGDATTTTYEAESRFTLETGTKTYDIQNSTKMIFISAIKADASSQRLTVEILKGGNVIESKFTDQPHGTVAAIAYI